MHRSYQSCSETARVNACHQREREEVNMNVNRIAIAIFNKLSLISYFSIVQLPRGNNIPLRMPRINVLS